MNETPQGSWSHIIGHDNSSSLRGGLRQPSTSPREKSFLVPATSGFLDLQGWSSPNGSGLVVTLEAQSSGAKGLVGVVGEFENHYI
ncbi:hypothetical protein INR49_023106 [Caranx melampygus]|nr:hypothetical protein INR49_023106 [Caranx melampygus]